MDYNIKNKLPVGQLYIPPIEDFNMVVDHILKTNYHTNHGLLLKELEDKLSIYLGVN